MTEQIDMSRFIEAKSDQLNADDLIGAPRTITITRVTGNEGDQPIAIHYQGDNGKPFKPCKTIRRVLMGVWGRYANEYVGKSMTLYRDDTVTFGGLQVGGIRISHMSGIDKETTVVVMKSKGKKAGMKILPLAAGAAQDEPYTVEEAEAALRRAASMEDLERAWRSRIMAPHRDALKPLLDERKAALADPFGGPAESDRGEPVTPASARDAIDACKTVADVNAQVSALVQHFDDEQADALRSYAVDIIAQMGRP